AWLQSGARLVLCLGLVLAAADAGAEPKFTPKEYGAPAAPAVPPAPAPAPPAAVPPARPVQPVQGTRASAGYQEEIELGGHEIRLLADGTELEFAGALTA